jgi:hypothetical protein
MTPPGQNPEMPGAPQQPPVPPAAPAPAGPPAAQPQTAPWLEKTVAVVYCVFCIEIGLFLLIYPWMRSWEYNYLIQLKPSLAGFLTSVQCRGAVSGLGILNLIVAVSEILALRRFSAR